jgi:hypothetical protein
MTNYSRTVRTCSDIKQCLLYYDYVIFFDPCLEFLDDFRKFGREEDISTILEPSLIPPKLAQNPDFIDRYSKVHDFYTEETVERGERILERIKHNPDGADDSDESSIEKRVAFTRDTVRPFMEHFGLDKLPVYCSIHHQVPSDDEVIEEPAVVLSGMKLIDIEATRFQHIIEFRQDPEALRRIRDFRLFAYSTYSEKCRSFVEDDLMKRMYEYEDAAKSWGFNLQTAAATTILQAKPLLGGLLFGAFSALFRSPLSAAASITAGALITAGQVAVEIKKQRFAHRKMERDHPISYITYAREALKNTA